MQQNDVKKVKANTMPTVFSKTCKIRIIEYGDNCDSFPLLNSFKTKVKDLITKKTA